MNNNIDTILSCATLPFFNNVSFNYSTSNRHLHCLALQTGRAFCNSKRGLSRFFARVVVPNGAKRGRHPPDGLDVPSLQSVLALAQRRGSVLRGQVAYYVTNSRRWRHQKVAACRQKKILKKNVGPPTRPSIKTNEFWPSEQ